MLHNYVFKNGYLANLAQFYLINQPKNSHITFDECICIIVNYWEKVKEYVPLSAFLNLLEHDTHIGD